MWWERLGQFADRPALAPTLRGFEPDYLSTVCVRHLLRWGAQDFSRPKQSLTSPVEIAAASLPTKVCTSSIASRHFLLQLGS
jgi:hypothetical protein